MRRRRATNRSFSEFEQSERKWNSRENVSPENSSRKSNSRKLVGIEVSGFASARGHPDVLGALIVKKSGADWSSLVRDSPLDRPQRLNKARD
jgi:hypothetical protein